MRNLTVQEARDFNITAENSIKRIDNAILTLKQTRDMIKSQHEQMLKDDSSAISLRAIDLVGYGDKLDRVRAELCTASTDLILIGRKHQDDAISKVG